MPRCIRFVVTLLCLVVAGVAHASSESLTFQRTTDGGFRAVIDGISDGPGCAPEYLPPESVAVAGSAITIVSPEDSSGCFLPMGPRPYEIVADLGVLADVQYDVTWTQPGLPDLDGVLVTAAIGNLAPNPEFDDGLDHWSPWSNGGGALAIDDETGLPDAPSLHVTGGGAESSCIAIDDSVPVDMRVLAQPSIGVAEIRIEAYSDAECSTFLQAIVTDSLPSNTDWQSIVLPDTTLPPGTLGVRLVLMAAIDPWLIPDIRFDHVQFGQSGSVPPGIPFAQEGLTGTWYDPSTSGQGFEIVTASADTVGGVSLFGAWYTYEPAGGPSAQRWYSLQSIEPSPTGPTTFAIFTNTGGNFAAPPVTTAEQVGDGAVTFYSCTSGLLTYALDDGAAGSIPIRRLMPNVECSPDGQQAPPPTSDFGLSGTWYDPATSGQGFVIEVNPDNATTFLGWYTYADSDHSQRWFSAQSTYTVGSTEIALTLYASRGGAFDAPGGVTTLPVGTATLSFITCGMATFEYAFTAGEMNGRRGTITLARLGALASCPLVS